MIFYGLKGASLNRITISIVTYLPDQFSLASTLKSLKNAVARLHDTTITIWIIDNSPPLHQPVWLNSLCNEYSAVLICGHGNIGFGRGHNLILDNIGQYHLILNPDVELAEDALVSSLDFMDSNPECGLLVPFACWPDGSQQYLCKRLPAIFDLFLRGFAPHFVQSWFSARLNHYEMRDVIGNTTYWDPPMASGCCMLFRSDVLRRLSGFDPGYFLYYEDSDISLRTSKISRIVYLPDMKIVHLGGNAARKGWRHIVMFIRSAARFFKIHGWRWV
jgi:GT2 family glycosyltransferase